MRERLLLLLVGAIGGLLSGAFGVGGGILMVPLLVLVIGMDQRRAAATSLVAIVPSAAAGAITYASAGRVDLAAAAVVAVGGVAGSLMGTRLLRGLPLGALRWAFVVLLVAVAASLLVAPPERSGHAVDWTWWTAPALVALGLLLGIASGLFGIGGGVIAVPGLIGLVGLSDLAAKGTSLLVMLPTAIVGTVSNTRARLVDPVAGAIVGVSATAASFGGVAIAFLLPAQLAGALFSGLLLVAATQLAVRAVRARA